MSVIFFIFSTILFFYGMFNIDYIGFPAVLIAAGVFAVAASIALSKNDIYGKKE